MTVPDAVSIENLVVSYRGTTVVDDLSFTAGAGQLTAVLGPNGAGKTTSIECAEGLRTPDSGLISVLGLPPQDPRLRHRVGVMLQDGGLPLAARAREVLGLVAALHSDPLDPDELMARLGITDSARTTVRRLSGGQRQRLGLAAAIVGKPELVFLDEPSAGLDPQSRLAVWEIVRTLREQGVSVVLTTHLLDEAEALADTVHIIDSGRLVASGTPAELVARYGGSHSQRVDLDRTLSAAEASDLGEALGPLLVEQQGSRLVLRGETSPASTARLAAWCADRDATITALATGGGTLEDAFLTLTGRELR